MEAVFRCRCISRGRGEGYALVCQEPIGFNFGVDVSTGTITERGHALCDKSFKDRVLIFPSGKGSTGGSYILYQVACIGTAPAAIINQHTEPIIASGAILARIPVVDRLDTDPFSQIRDGDYVVVDAVRGLVTVRREEGAGNETDR